MNRPGSTAASSSEILLPGLDGKIRELDDLARGLAAAWTPRARAATTIGRERALLRLYGVEGLDRSGLPLSGSVVDRLVGGSRARLADGVSLPFAIALAEYDVAPQQLATDVAAGLVDLEKEAGLLGDRDQRTRAEAMLGTLVDGALARIDANRTATHELCSVLGDAPQPWVSTAIGAPEADDAARDVSDLARAGFDVLRIEVPMGRELSGLLEAAGIGVEPWRPSRRAERDGPADHGQSAADVTPAGSQRGLAVIRQALDEAAATRRRYVRLASVAPPLAAPEQAVVAAFERVDLVVADAMTEIVTRGVDPDRALADHAFAAAIHRRSGTTVLMGAGPLVVGPDLSTGLPSSAATRSGRALALQLLGVHIARASELGAAQLIAGAVPAFLTDEPSGAAFALAEVTLRRRLLPDHSLWFTTESGPWGSPGSSLLQIGTVLPGDGSAALLQVDAETRGRSGPDESRSAARQALETGLLLAGSRSGASLAGVALEHARATVDAAITALEGLSRDGWSSILGEGFDDPERHGFGSDAVAERSDLNEPLAARSGG